MQKNCTKKDLHNPYNHDGVITHLEPDILECEVKSALGSITTNKASVPALQPTPVPFFTHTTFGLGCCCLQMVL